MRIQRLWRISKPNLKTKGVKTMKNYQKLHYSKYQIMQPTGECHVTTRRECFAPAEQSTSNNPFTQRFYFDPESGVAIRLPRNEMGEILGKRNAADLKTEERRLIRQYKCVWKDTDNCDHACENCNYKNKNRNVELDKNWNNEDFDSETRFDIADEAADIVAIVEDKEKLSILFVALAQLSSDDQDRWDFLVKNEKKQVIADRFGLTLDGVRYREQRLYKKLRLNETLKKFFE
jgi:hypothetical protein